MANIIPGTGILGRFFFRLHFPEKILPYPTTVCLLEGSMAVILWEHLGK